MSHRSRGADGRRDFTETLGGNQEGTLKQFLAVVDQLGEALADASTQVEPVSSPTSTGNGGRRKTLHGSVQKVQNRPSARPGMVRLGHERDPAKPAAPRPDRRNERLEGPDGPVSPADPR